MKLKKEIIAILGGVAFAYMFQLFMLLLIFIIDPNSSLLKPSLFVPIWTIQIAIVPQVSWILMGLVRVSWFDKWVRITVTSLAFLIPFSLIAVLTVILLPSLWWKPTYWVVTCIASIILALTVFKPLTKLRLTENNA